MPSFSPNSAALRAGRRSIPGQVYLVTTRTHQRRSWFESRSLGAAAAGVLGDDRTWPGAVPLAWVLMPDHLHALLELAGAEPLPVVVARVKALVSRRLHAETPGPIWQPSFHDHALRREAALLAVGRYLVDNPVRAGLVDQPDAWPWRGGRLLAAIDAELPG